MEGVKRWRGRSGGAQLVEGESLKEEEREKRQEVGGAVIREEVRG